VLYICYMVGQHDRAAILRERKAPNMKQLRSRFRSDWGHLGKIRQSRVFMG
jgi:hypothetical protein